MAKDHDDPPFRIDQRQAQPELKDMRLSPWGQRHDTLRWASAFHDFAISLFPIAALVAKFEFV